MQTWELEDARKRFSEVVRLARSHKPQLVTRNGRDCAERGVPILNPWTSGGQ